MSSAADNARYIETVQSLYLQLRGGGLVLAPIDTDRIRSWRDGGVPLDLALQGVRAAHKAWASGGSRMRPFALRSAERYVAELAAGWERKGGAHAAAPQQAAPPRARAAGGPLPRCIAGIEARLHGGGPAARAAYAAALAILAPRAAATAGLDAVLHAADEAQALAYLHALPRPAQRAVATACRAEAGARAGVPRRSYRAMLRALLCDAARAHGNLLRPSDLT
ncbi:hypothetical protein [Vulgatibacter sp.]|uniref:hypothetical protein n=1 Tax=Vulgatibacter sp. TaxID=1971226 RepID=UPI00356967C9